MPDVPIIEPPLLKVRGKWCSAGALVVEADASIWLFEPKNHYGGYNWTFPKGRIEPGMTPQQTAHKEVAEETGLTIEIACLGIDQERTASTTRYYLAKHRGGASDQFRPDETQSVRRLSLCDAYALLNTKTDRDALIKLVSLPEFPSLLNLAGLRTRQNFLVGIN